MYRIQGPGTDASSQEGGCDRGSPVCAHAGVHPIGGSAGQVQRGRSAQETYCEFLNRT